MQSKPITFKNTINGEQWVCEDARKVKVIDGVNYVTVHKPNNLRTVLMRKDTLVPVKIKQ